MSLNLQNIKYSTLYYVLLIGYSSQCLSLSLREPMVGGGNRAVILSLPVSTNIQSACLMATPSKTLVPTFWSFVFTIPIILIIYSVFYQYHDKNPHKLWTCNSMHSTPYANSTEITSPECPLFRALQTPIWNSVPRAPCFQHMHAIGGSH
ncbi:unnamed protein product [Penicillium nalgiovense]|nr:unnamed protein product [Penicillium nalgiovense]